MIKKFLLFFSLKISRIKQKSDYDDIFVKNIPENRIVNIVSLSALSNKIKGMITSRAGEELLTQVFMQSIQVDVVEIGSFQGKSTYFLGTAVKLSSNGKMYAIDH